MSDSGEQSADDAARMSAAMMRFVRDFGLLQPDRTPCGRPLTVTQAHALSRIARLPGITQRDLGAALGLARASTSELVADLQGRGWLTQAPSAQDRRQRSLALTEAGRGVAERVATARRELMQGLLAEVPADERRALVDAIELLSSATARYRNRFAELDAARSAEPSDHGPRRGLDGQA